MATKNEEQSTQSVADKNYERTFGTQSSQLQSEEEGAVKNDTAPKDIKSQESQAAASWKTKTSGKHAKKTPVKARFKGSLRHKSAFAFVIVVIVGGVWYSSIFAPNIIMVNIKDLFTNDLADATTALSKYSLKMIDQKLNKAGANCNDPDTIKCKLATMSRAQVQAFKTHGFQVNGQKVKEDNLDDNNPANDKPESRWKVQSVTFPDGGGTATDGASFARIASSNDHLRQVANGVWNPRSSFFMDARYKERIKTQFDLTKAATVYGRSEKAVDESFDKSMQGEDEIIDKGGGGAYSLKTLGSQKGQSGLFQTATEIAKMPHTYTNAQCGFYTQGKVVYNATKKAKEVTLARFAMQYLKAADQIKAGVSDELTANVLSGKLAWSSDGGYDGANATDAAMYRHIVLREPLKNSQNGTKYYADAFDAIGALLVPFAQLISTSNTTKAITGSKYALAPPPGDIGMSAVEYCLHGQTGSSKTAMKPSKCPDLTMAAGAAPLLAPLLPALGGIAALSSRICPPPILPWQMNPTASMTSVIVMPLVAGLFNAAVSTWANRVALDFTHDTKGTAASDAIFAGTGIILGDMAMSRGMQPATAESLKTYLADKAEYDKEYEAIARYEARQSPFDIYNSHSFLGSLVRSFSTTPVDNTYALGVLNNILAIIPSSVTKTTSTASAIYNLQPAPLVEGRLSCDDAEYKYIGIAADRGCNVRYSMGKQEMDASVNNVLDYMLKSHSDEYKDKLNDLQQRLSQTDTAEPQDPGEVSRMIRDMREASNKPFIDKKTGEATPHSEYEKYLDYCVNRQDPWGRSGLAVRREEISAEEKEKRRSSKSPDGIQVEKRDTGSEYERVFVSSQMSVTEGAKADQDWYTGKKCLENSEMLRNFRAYTMACSVDGSFAGSIDCTEADRAGVYTDDFYTSNDIQYLSWY